MSSNHIQTPINVEQLNRQVLVYSIMILVYTTYYFQLFELYSTSVNIATAHCLHVPLLYQQLQNEMNYACGIYCVSVKLN